MQVGFEIGTSDFHIVRSLSLNKAPGLLAPQAEQRRHHELPSLPGVADGQGQG